MFFQIKSSLVRSGLVRSDLARKSRSGQVWSRFVWSVGHVRPGLIISSLVMFAESHESLFNFSGSVFNLWSYQYFQKHIKLTDIYEVLEKIEKNLERSQIITRNFRVLSRFWDISEGLIRLSEVKYSLTNSIWRFALLPLTENIILLSADTKQNGI